MNFSSEMLLAASPKDAARLLYDAGRDLRGKNLRRGSWLEIAHALRVQRTALLLLPRLQAATTRDDALRVLRLARKWTRVRTSGGAKRAKAVVRPTAIIPEDSALHDEWLEGEIEWDAYFDEEMYGQVRGPAYARVLDQLPGLEQLWVPDLKPASPIQLSLIEYALARRVHPAELVSSIRGRLDDATVRQLLTLGTRAPVELDADERDFFTLYDLTRLRDWLDQPDRAATDQALSITTGPELAGATLLQKHGVSIGAFAVDWDRLAAWLIAVLAQPPAADRDAIWLAAYTFGLAAPIGSVHTVAAVLDQMHSAWLPLLLTWTARRGEWWPRPVKRPAPKPRFPQFMPDMSRPAIVLPPWETLLAVSHGSRLVLHLLRCNFLDTTTLQHWPPAVREDLIDLLVSGSGTLRRLDYPAFTLTCRPTVSLVKLSTFTELVDLARALLNLKFQLQRGDSAAMMVSWIEDRYRQRQPGGLAAVTREALVTALTRHTIAYALLKWQVLIDQSRQGGFRLRRKHIQQFWRDQAAGLYPDLSVPRSVAELYWQIGAEHCVEALASAVLDHFKEAWPGENGEAIGLKEECILALRWLALTYHLEVPRIGLPAQPTEADLSRAAEVADLLISQMQHSPLELASALMIPHQQGLPRLTGGGLTDWERQCRQLLRDVAGSLRVLEPQTEAQVFDCRPISKLAALDRGTLGGDCSSGSVPFRALSPHHVYYGIWQQGEPQRGYMTVYEAWAEVEAGERWPVLCLETINVPNKWFDAVQGDLLEIFSAIAHSRGLHGLVLITGIGTWNYQNGEVLRWSRRFRQGTPVELSPADPVQWKMYALLTTESEYYSAFLAPKQRTRLTESFRLLAPFDPVNDRILPENQAEADRLRALPPRQLIVTARSEQGVAGFISELPTVF